MVNAVQSVIPPAGVGLQLKVGDANKTKLCQLTQWDTKRLSEYKRLMLTKSKVSTFGKVLNEQLFQLPASLELPFVSGFSSLSLVSCNFKMSEKLTRYRFEHYRWKEMEEDNDLTDEEREDEFEAEQAEKSAREAFELSRGCE